MFSSYPLYLLLVSIINQVASTIPLGVNVATTFFTLIRVLLEPAVLTKMAQLNALPTNHSAPTVTNDALVPTVPLGKNVATMFGSNIVAPVVLFVNLLETRWCVP